LTSRKLAFKVAKIIEEKKGKDLVILNLKKLTFITDYFLICSGDSPLHMRSIGREIVERLKKENIDSLSPNDFNNPRWVLLDFGEVVVHIFSREAREFYALERLWADAKRVKFPSNGGKKRKSVGA